MGRLKMLMKKPIWKRICHQLAGKEFTFATVRDMWAEQSPSTCPTTMQLATILRCQPQVYIIQHHYDKKKMQQTFINSQGRETTSQSNERRQTYGICDQWIADNPL